MVRKRSKKVKWIIAAIIVIVIIGGLGVYLKKDKSVQEVKYITVPVTRGDISATILTSGVLEPVSVVSVGSQISGMVEKIYVDYNSKVVKGQVLARLDTTSLQAQYDSAKANVEKMQAQLELAKVTYDNTQKLYEKNYTTQDDYNQKQSQYRVAIANLASAQADFNTAKSTLSKATITAPISGTIISRSVSEGQTVAASLQAPELFSIAQNLTQMQLNADVSEADISRIHTGQKVNFTVFSYANQVFTGTVKEIRLNAVTQNNVVTYEVVILVNNPDLKLLPGMTATIKIETESDKGVLMVPNAIFTYQPEGKSVSVSGGSTTVYLDKNGGLVPVSVKKGISNGTMTEISGDIASGDSVIAGVQKEISGKKVNLFKSSSKR